MKKFKVINCERKGCVYFHKGKCWLDGQIIEDWIEQLMGLHDGKQCQVRHQINIMRTKDLLEGK